MKANSQINRGNRNGFFISKHEIVISKPEIIVSCFETIVSSFEMNNRSVRVHFFNRIVQTILPVRGENFTGESIVLMDLTYSLNIKESAEPVWARLISLL